MTSTFVKILKPERDAKARGREMQQTIAFREYVHLQGELALGFGGSPKTLDAMPKTLDAIKPWLAQVNYFGKRGSFYQLLALPETVTTEGDAPPAGFLDFPGYDLLSGKPPTQFPLGLIQRVDEWGQALTFDAANIYNRERKADINLGKERRRADVILPYRMVRSSRGLTLYERFEA